MSSSIHNAEFINQLEHAVRLFVKEKLELLMREEIANFLTVEQPDTPNSRNGYYTRTLDTKFGKIDDLRVPRDRQGEFQTQVFEPYQRRDGWLEEAVIRMYKGGMSTREVGDFIESIIGTHYSPATVSNITNTVLQDVHTWQERPLNQRYSVLYIDGIHFNLRRDSVANEVLYVAMAIDEEGRRQVLGFVVGGHESAHGWQTFLQDLYNRGATDILLGVFDGLVGLEEAFHSVYPKADIQRCVVHKIRNLFPKIRVKDKLAFMSDLKLIYTAPIYEQALRQCAAFELKWAKVYPREVASWKADLPVLLTFYKYPEDIWARIYTTNAIERTMKEIRKRLYPMNSLPNVDAAEKIAYLVVNDYNQKWATRIIRGFGMATTQAIFKQMYEERYGAKE
jgi:putative transposase